MKTFTTIAAAGLMAVSAAAFAAHPTSIRFDQYAKTNDGSQFAKFVVQCSNGKSMPLTAWNNQRKWCVGDKSQENCHRKQLEAAQAACRIR